MNVHEGRNGGKPDKAVTAVASTTAVAAVASTTAVLEQQQQCSSSREFAAEWVAVFTPFHTKRHPDGSSSTTGLPVTSHPAYK